MCLSLDCACRGIARVAEGNAEWVEKVGVEGQAQLPEGLGVDHRASENVVEALARAMELIAQLNYGYSLTVNFVADYLADMQVGL